MRQAMPARLPGNPKLSVALLAAGVLATTGPAATAQPTTGLYIAAGAGANWALETNNAEVRLSPQVGVVALGSVGWGFGNGLRVELEGNYRSNNNRGTVLTAGNSLTGGSGANAFSVSNAAFGQNGRLQTYGAMANLVYDIPIPALPLLQPYVGAGIGIAWAELSGLRQVYATSVSVGARPLGTSSLTLSTDDTVTRFAYQAILGVGYSLAQWVPGLTLTAEYRFYGTLSPEWSVRAVASGPAGTQVTTGRFPANNLHNSVLVGLRYAFGATPPPPAAPEPLAEAPVPARTFLVFFDWDRAELSERARQIIGEAAENSRRVPVTRIEVAGHADRSGAPAYNMRLSRRRADAVAAELVRRGVARSLIAIAAFGESRPLVPTADGVREAQNRRVEIVLR